MKEIREEYFNSLGIDELLKNMMEKKEMSIDSIKEGHLKFYHK